MKRFFRAFKSLNPISLTTYTLILVLVLFMVGVPLLELIELKTIDLRFLSRDRLKPPPDVVIAVIDEKSLDEEGRWPWPRRKIAALINALSQDGAKVIGFDIGFLEPDENSYLEFIDRLDHKMASLEIKDDQLNRFLQESKKAADNDLALAKAIKASSATVVLGYFFHLTREDLDYVIGEKRIEEELEKIAPSKYPLIIYEDPQVQRAPFIRAYAPEGNLELFTEKTKFSGYFNMLPDRDGSVRWLPLIMQCGEDVFPPLSLECVWQYLDRPQLMVRVAGYGVRGIQMGERFIPTDENGQMLINYMGPPKSFPHYSITDILKGNYPQGTFQDKVILVGATAVGIYDMRITPFSPVFPGVEIHATAIDNILKERFLHKPKWAVIFDMLAIVALGVVMGLFLPRLRAVKGVFFAVGLFVLYILLARWLFTGAGILVNLVYPLLAVLLTYTCLTVYHYITEERERKKIKGAFSYYVSSSVVNEMLKYPEQLKLGGEKRDLSVLFSDIRGFTTISEGLTPEDLVQLLNEYLTVMTDVVFKYDGTLDKYIGDAIMAIYGAPLEQWDHPSRACYSALEMMEKLKALNEKWIKQGKKPLDIGIGINTDDMMVGNMGSDQRFDYTVMGDAVNLGSRLEGINKTYKTHILISEFTYERVKDEFLCMEVDCVRVKGKSLPVKIYQLLGTREAPEERNQIVSLFHEGLDLYKNRKWDEAIETFKRVKDRDADLYVADLYVQRSLEFKAEPPPPEWDGVCVMTTK